MTPAESLQAALAGEHAAVYVYGVIGGRVSVSAEPALAERVRAAYTQHRARRDQLVAILRAAGEEPVASEVSYELPNQAQSARQLRSASATIELRACGVYADVVGSTSQANRQWALDAVEDSAVRALGFGAAPEAFPGITGL